MNQIKVILASFALATILFLLVFQYGALSAIVLPTFQILRRHIVAFVVVLIVLMAIKAVSAGPRLPSR